MTDMALTSKPTATTDLTATTETQTSHVIQILQVLTAARAAADAEAAAAAAAAGTPGKVKKRSWPVVAPRPMKAQALKHWWVVLWYFGFGIGVSSGMALFDCYSLGRKIAEE